MKRKWLSVLLAVILVFCLVPGPVAQAAETSAIDPDTFMAPDMEYRPGVRWWWPGNAASTEDLKAQIDYLAENGFGAVEIVAFSAGFLLGPEGAASGSIYQAMDGYDFDAILSYDTPEYYEKLNEVVAYANQKGIVVDLNAGSGYLANDDSVPIEQSQGNMALGRQSITVNTADLNSPMAIDIPDVEISAFYVSTLNGIDIGEWSQENVKLNAVLVSKILDKENLALASNNQFVNLEANTIDKTYNNQYLLDPEKTTVIHSEALKSGPVTFTPEEAGEYEVVAVYSVPSGSIGLNSIIEKYGEEGHRSYVADHLSADAITGFVNGWLGDEGLAAVVEDNDVRAVFNDSYEFYTDVFYNDYLYELAADSGNVIGYDITKFLPAFYAVLEESFILGTITPKIEGVNVAGGFFGGGSPLLAVDVTEDEWERIEYDYHQLVNQAFLEGMDAFSTTLGQYGLAYRQQAYNPPIDTLKSSQYVDIPETEGESEYALRRVASGAHLYGKNLVTSEVYTLGNTPFNVQPQKIKRGFDLMATSGVNNFFYHGLDAPYYGSDSPDDDNYFSEEGWRAWPTIGVEMGATNSISAYFKGMNEYAARANYVMQAGSPSADVAYYMPLFGSLSETSGFVTSLNTNGYGWDAINDDSIQTLAYTNGKLVTTAGAAYSALVVDGQTLPVATMEALQALAAAGAPVFFCGNLPNSQPSYAGGSYAALDAQVATIATASVAAGAKQAATPRALAAQLAAVITPPISYAANSSVRFNRRTLETGGELAYIRNTSQTAATTISLQVDPALPNTYWLDQADGKIYAAANEGGSIQVTLPADGAIILLAEPAGVEMEAAALSKGLPLDIDTAEPFAAQTLEDWTLTVTADNIGTHIPGTVQTKTYNTDVLGNWGQATFQNGELLYVSDPGLYSTTFQVDNLAVYDTNRMVLDLGELKSTAAVYVNGSLAGQIFATPYRLDIADYLVEGENTLEIEVQPLRHNRRVGLRKAYTQDGIQKYMAYNSHVGGNAAVTAAGLTGPVTLATAPAANNPLALTTKAQSVVAGEYFEVNAAFGDVQPSNAIVLNYSFDGSKFEYDGYALPEDGNVGVVEEESGEGWAKVTLMVPSYEAGDLGSLKLHAKEDAVLAKEKQQVTVEANYVLKGAADDKSIELALAGVSFTTLGDGETPEPGVKGDTNGDRIVDLIDLSNMVDWFGYSSTHADWDSKYVFFDFNRNDQIDIYDISYVARLIS